MYMIKLILNSLNTYFNQSVIQRFPLFGGHSICTAIHSDQQRQSVIERLVLLWEFVIRGSAVYNTLV